MKKVISLILVCLFLSIGGSSYAEYTPNYFNEHSFHYCTFYQELIEELNSPDPDFDLIERLLTELLKFITTDFGGYFIPLHALNGTDDLRFLVEAFLPPELTQLMTDQVYIDTWNLIEDYFSVELDAARNGINSISKMVTFLQETEILDQLHLSSYMAFIKMSNMDLNPSYLSPVGDPGNPPLGDIIDFPAEFDPVEAVIVEWPSFQSCLWTNQAKFIKAITDAGAKAYVLVRNAFWHKAALLTLRSFFGGNMSIHATNTNVKFLYIPGDMWWTRDNIGYFVKNDSGNMVLVGQEYYPLGPIILPDSYMTNERLSDYLGIPFYNITHNHPYIDEGGNLLSDGNGTVFVLESVFETNPDLTQSELETIAQEYWGASRVVVLPRVYKELSGHIDVVVKILSPETILVAETIWDTQMGADLDAIAAQLENTPSHGGSGPNYNVIRIPVPYSTLTDPLSLTQHSYVNSFIVNNTVIMASYNFLQDYIAEMVYMNAGYNVIKVDAKSYLTGSLHCASKEVPVGTFNFIP